MSQYCVAVLFLATLFVPSVRSSTQAATIAPQNRATIRRIIELINVERAAADLPALTIHPLLMAEAQRFSGVLAIVGTVSHRGNDGTNAGQRLTRVGYKWRYFGENLAAGQITADKVVTAWMKSPSHRAIVLSPKATHVGIGHTSRPSDPRQYVDYYVMEAGRPR